MEGAKVGFVSSSILLLFSEGSVKEAESVTCDGRDERGALIAERLISPDPPSPVYSTSIASSRRVSGRPRVVQSVRSSEYEDQNTPRRIFSSLSSLAMPELFSDRWLNHRMKTVPNVPRI